MDEADTGEIPVVDAPQERQPIEELILIRFELERIRYRLGVLVVWFVVLPVVAGLIVLVVASANS